MMFTRRRFLKLGAMAGAGLALPVAAAALPVTRVASSEAIRSPRVEKFSVELPVPPVAKPKHSHGDTDYYEMTQRTAMQEILPGFKTEVWGYDGEFPGPTVEARSGREVVIRQRNELPVPVVVHLHGGVTPPEHDGYPTDYILPANGSTSSHSHRAMGETTTGERDYEYPNEQRAATLWYHDHRMDFTGPQVYRGLAGMYILRDDVEDDLPLPRQEKEVPLVLTDRTFSEDGSFYYPSIDPTLTEEPGVLVNASNGMYGDTMLLNGAPWPYMEVSNTKYRFRILNASNARAYDLALDPPPDGGPSFVQIGSDGGLLEAPIPHERILTSPAERFDVIVDFSKYPIGTKVTLKNARGEGEMVDVMRFVVARREEEYAEVPDVLDPDLRFPSSGEVTERRDMNFVAGALGGMSTINNRVFDPDVIDAAPALDSTEIWNVTGDPSHPFHMHLVHFRVISRDGGPPGPYDAGWKDTVFLKGGSVDVIAKFEGWRGKYVFHCHNLEHEDMMMMANFEVV